MWPQILVLVFFTVRLIFNIVNEGEPKDQYFDTMNFIISAGFFLFVLYSGGFFDCFFHAH